jgi:hypothetical protein
VNRSNLPKPILTRGPIGALRYAWLRAPPFHRAKPDPDLSEALTHKSPYEGGQRRSCAVPTLRNRCLGEADASEAGEFYGRAAQVDAKYRAEKIDLKSFDPAGGNSKITIERQPNTGA